MSAFYLSFRDLLAAYRESQTRYREAEECRSDEEPNEEDPECDPGPDNLRKEVRT